MSDIGDWLERYREATGQDMAPAERVMRGVGRAVADTSDRIVRIHLTGQPDGEFATTDTQRSHEQVLAMVRLSIAATIDYLATEGYEPAYFSKLIDAIGAKIDDGQMRAVQ